MILTQEESNNNALREGSHKTTTGRLIYVGIDITKNYERMMLGSVTVRQELKFSGKEGKIWSL